MRSITTTCVLFLACAGLFAQSTSQISGTIQDPSGSAIPGAQITATQTDTGVARATQSGADGRYVLNNLAIGPYKIEVKRDGFSAYAQSGIVLQVGSNPTVDISLKVGAVSEQVQVTADATMVETQNSGVGQVVDQRRVVDLPLNGRLATQLITLAGAAATVPQANTGQLSTAKNYPNEAVISVGGGMSNGLTYVMDGGTYNDPINNANLPLPFPDALQEFKVETSALPAQYGHHSAGAVNVVTKSGTNSFHGDAFEFLRNGDFNARDTFSPARDALKRSQFGGTLGGPIKKDKFFFFVGYQGTEQHSAPTIGTSFIPTPAMLRGDFSAIASPACNSGKQILLKNPANGALFAGNQISTALFSPQALKADSYYGTTTDPCGQVHFGSLANLAEHMGVAKGDYQISSKQSIFARYLITHYFAPSSYTGTPLSVTQPSPDDLVNSAVFGDNYVLSPTKLNSFHASFNRSAIVKTQVPLFGAHDLGIVGVTELYPEYLSLNVTGALYTNGNGSNPGTNFTDTHQFADDMSILKGSHQIQFGGNYIRSISNSIVLLSAPGAFTFNGQQSGLPMVDFLLGYPSTFTQNAINQDYERYQYIAAYVQDSWKINRRLTANVGLRWEPFLGGARQYGWVSHFDQGLFAQNVHSTVYTNAPPGVLYPGDPGFDTNSHPTKSKWNDFAPRAGIVWDPKGDGKMTVRASWGIFYDLPHTLFFYNYAGETPWGTSITINTPPGGFANPYLGYPGGSPFPITLGKNAPFPNNEFFETVPLNVKVTYLEQWNLSVQRQIGKDWLASGTYLGNNTIHLWTDRELNPAVYIGGNCPAGQYGLKTAGPCSSSTNTSSRKLLTLENPVQGPIFNSLELLDDGGTASYNALLLSLQHRLANNFTVLANYTWSHCIADLATTELSGPMYTNPNDRRFDRGGCPGVDLRHVFNLSVVAQAPKFSQRAVDAIAGHWQLSVISNVRSGINFNATTGVDNALLGVATTAQRPNLVLPSPYCANKGPGTCWLNGAAFASPAPGTFGNLGINSLVGPRYFDIDVSLSRSFQVREHMRFEIRGEAFNIQNRVNYNTPGVAQSVLGTAPVALNSTSFGKLLADVSPRIVQLAAKITF